MCSLMADAVMDLSMLIYTCTHLYTQSRILGLKDAFGKLLSIGSFFQRNLKGFSMNMCFPLVDTKSLT